MKSVFLLLMCLMLFTGCAGSVALQDKPEETPVPTQSPENIAVGKESESKSDGGVKLTVETSKEDQQSGLMKTTSYYMFDGDKLVSIKNENTYKNEETAQKNEELFKTKPESCVDVSRNGTTVTYYASVSAMEFMKDMKREDVKTMGESIGAGVEEF